MLQRTLDRIRPRRASPRPPARRFPIDYAAEGRAARGGAGAGTVRPRRAPDAWPEGRVPLTLALTSPARRPIQVTKDLPGFWRGSWAECRKEMRGRYPRHPWPEDPLAAPPTTRAKPRGT